MVQDKEKIKKIINTIILKETLINYSSVFLGGIFWIAICVTGVEVITKKFINNEFYPLITIFWLIAMIYMTKIVGSPIITYREGVIENGKKDE